jgi:hypothetical protein
MSKIALLPGGFKPPHAGHYNMAKWLSANTGADTTIIFVGPKERDGITQEMSLKLWKLYTQNDSGLEVRPAGVSPVRDVYDFVEQEAPEGSTVFLGMGEKDISDKRFANIPKFAEPRGITFETKLVPPQAGGVSGTEMRGFIKMNDKALFQYSLPNHLSDKQKEQAWSIVTGLDEDLYDPRDKYYDFAKTNDPEPKKLVPNNYKYSRRNFPFRSMYENKGKILHAYDFDDTIARVKANIKTTITSPSGDYKKEILIPAENFPEESKALEARLGNLEIKYDFSEFEKQINDAIVNSKVVNKLQKSLSNPQVKTTILTARSIGHPVTKYLKSIGLDAYVVPLGLQVKGKVRGIDKANWIEKHINKGYNTIYFIDDSEDNRTAVAALKDKYPDIKLKVEDPAAVSEMMMGMMTKQEKAKHAKNLKRLSKDLKKQGDKYMKVPKYVKGTLTRKMYEEMSAADLDSIETYADNKLDPIDVEFTNHFFDRINDPRNKKEISSAELIGFFKRLSKNKKAFIEFLKQYKEIVATDNRTNLNIPFVNQANKAIAKTVMRKKDFQTTNPQLDLERKLTKGELKDRERIAQDLPDKEFKKRYGKDWKSVKLATATKLAKKEGMYPPYKADQVQKVRYQASDTFTNSPKQAKKRGYLQEKDPKKGTGKKPKGSGRRLYTDEDPSDTVKVKFSTRQDIVDTLSKKSFKAKSHARKSQIINLIHQRVRAALSRTKDPKKKAKLRSGFEYIKKRKEASKRKTQRMKKESVFSKNWWKEQLKEVITETKANTHLTHLEELVLTQGQDGFNQAKNFLYELIKNLKGQDNTIKNVSVKWDGAPAIFTGINPDNGQFFVGTKSVFNKEPKINYTPKDIDQNHGHAAGLAKKLKLALQYLPSLGIKNILQGDFMFDNDDVETEDIDGIPHYTFKPNTIRYAVEANSELGKQIIAARIGIIFHTTYNDLSGGGASFGADVSGLSKSPSVWFDDAFFKDDTGILLNDKEEQFILDKINEADSINVDYTNLPLKNLNTYINSEIRQGEFLNDPSKSFERFKNWYQQAVDKSIEKVKRPETKEKKKQAGEEKLREFESQKQDIINIFKVSKLLSEAKSIFITKYDKAVATKHFIDNGDGTLRVTKAEGFVAVDHTENGIKLVDRLEFSKNNFNAGKPGAKK